MSAIAWAGFDSFAYFFSHEDSRDAFAIPHGLRILQEVFGLTPGGYRRTNAFWTATEIRDLVAEDHDRGQLEAQCARIRAAYDDLSAAYQEHKPHNAIPLR